MLTRIKFPLLIGTLLCCAFAAQAQETKTLESIGDEVLRVNTRVVFLDASVREKRTGAPVFDLKPENFEVLADGRRREVSYFSREGDQGRRPLALTLIFDLERHGAGRYMRRTEILEAMAAELSKLPPEDEVAIIVLNAGGVDGKPEWLTRFTRQRAQTATALSMIPTLVAAGAEGGGDSGNASQITLTAENPEAMKTQLEDIEKAHRGEAGEGDEVEQIVDKDGNKITRTVKPDGTILLQRVNKDGSTTVDVTGASALSIRLTREITRFAAQERPHSQAAVVLITDGIVPMFYAERDYIEAKLLRSNVIFSALVTDMKTGFKFLLPVVKPLGNWIGLSIAGSAQHLAKRTGGEALKVRRPADYASGLNKIIGSLNARYSLGFTLAENETDDGRQHALEVKVRARDAKGKERKLEVKARGGYYMPAVEKKAAEEVKKETVNR